MEDEKENKDRHSMIVKANQWIFSKSWKRKPSRKEAYEILKISIRDLLTSKEKWGKTLDVILDEVIDRLVAKNEIVIRYKPEDKSLMVVLNSRTRKLLEGSIFNPAYYDLMGQKQ